MYGRASQKSNQYKIRVLPERKEVILQTEATAMTMAQIMENVGTIVENSITWISDFASVITSNPLILAFVLVAFVGLSVGLIRRLISL